MQIDTQQIVVLAIVALVVGMFAWLIVRNARARRAERLRLADLAARRRARTETLERARANDIAILDMQVVNVQATTE